MSQKSGVRKLKKETVEEKITSLRENAFALIKEIREFGSVAFADVSQGIDMREEVRRLEIRLITRALEETNGSQVAAARLLGLKITTLNAKIKRYGLDPNDISLPEGEQS
jgi:transcriptional regulator with GAF, ATPase, and Fis domain